MSQPEPNLPYDRLLQRLTLLAEASAALASSLDYEATLSVISRLALPILADWSFTDVVTGQGELRRIALTHESDAVLQRRLDEYQRDYPPRWEVPSIPIRVMTQGERIHVRHVSAEALRAMVDSQAQWERVLELRIGSVASVPMRSRGATLGAMTFVRHPERVPFDEHDVETLAELAERGALALQNAQLMEDARAKAAELEAILESIADGVLVYDAERRIVRSNGVADDILQYPQAARRKTMIDRLASEAIEVLSEDGRPLELEQFPAFRAIAHGEMMRATLRMRRGVDERWLQMSAAPLLRGETCSGAVVSLSDVTERKRVEEALRRTEERLLQAQKVESIGRLAGGIAHDFNNLLTAILGYAELLRPDLPANEESQSALEEIVKAGRRATALTTQLLAFARRQVINARVLDPNDVVRDAERILRRLVGEDVEIVTVLEPGVGKVKADPNQLQQVLVNLVVNARDAMPGGGRLVIETRDVMLGGEDSRDHSAPAPGPYVMLAVADTGTGMPPEVVAHLFEPFFTTKEQGKGTGLGLATCHGIITQNGGYIDVYTNVGLGTTVRC